MVGDGIGGGLTMVGTHEETGSSKLFLLGSEVVREVTGGGSGVLFGGDLCMKEDKFEI